MPRLTTWVPFFLRRGSAHVDNVIAKRCSKQSHSCPWLPLTRLQSNKPHRNSPKPSEPCLQYLHQDTPELSGTFRNPQPSGTCFRNLHQHTPELSETFRNLPPEPTPAHAGTLRNLPPEPASGTYTSTHWNSPEPSGTCLRNLHQQHTGTLRNLPEPASATYTSNTPELSGTFRNPSPEPAPATRAGTHRSLSGLKTPLAFAVGEKWFLRVPMSYHFIEEILTRINLFSLLMCLCFS